MRNDLGPMPNVTYDFATRRARGEVGHSWRLTETLDVLLSGHLEGLIGAGAVTFLASTDTPLAPVPANVWEWNAGATVSARLSF